MKIRNKNLYKKLLIMIMITFLTQLCTLFRVSIVASNFGVSVELDAFNFANTMAVLIFSFITTGVTTVLIPNLNKAERQESINSFLTIVYGGGTFLLIVFLLFNKEIISIISNNKNEYFIELSSNILRILLISQYLTTYLGLSNAVLQINNQFNKSKLAILITTIISITIIIINSQVNIYEYALIINITAIINVVLQFILMIKTSKFKFKIKFNYKDEKLKKLLKNFIPIIFSTGVYQISLMIDTLIASGLGVGQISILNYSNNIIGMINAIIVGNIITFLFPKIVKDIEINESKENILKYITIINSILFLVVIGFFAVGKDLLKILYYRGNFTSLAIEVVYTCTLIYVIATPISASRNIIYKYFYANNDTYTPFTNSLFISLLNIIISVILSKFIGLYGVVLGTTISSIVSFITISIKLKKKFGVKVNTFNFFIKNSSVLVASIMTLIIVKYLQSIVLINNILINIFITSIGTVVIYIVILNILKNKILKYKL